MLAHGMWGLSTSHRVANSLTFGGPLKIGDSADSSPVFGDRFEHRYAGDMVGDKIHRPGSRFETQRDPRV